MRKKDTSCQKSNTKKELVDPESVAEASYENGKATPAEMRRRHLVIIRHAAGIQLVATAPLIALASALIRQEQTPLTFLVMLAVIAGLSGVSYGWSSYGSIAQKAIDDDRRDDITEEAAGLRRRPVGATAHMGIILIPMLLAPALGIAPMHMFVLAACSVTMASASRVMWTVVGVEAKDTRNDTGRD